MSRLSTKQRRAARRRRPLFVFFDGFEWWVARDVEDARAQQREAHGDEVSPAVDWAMWPPAKSLTMCDTDGDGQDIKRTCAEWARTCGRGFLGGTDY